MSKIKSYGISSVLACQLSLLVGTAQGFSAILLPQLGLSINLDQSSWIASLGIICRPLGALFEGILVDKIGRKRTLQLVAALFSLSWILTALSTDITFLYASRIFISFTGGMAICVGLYIVEITRPKDRGTYLSMITPSVNAGILLVYFLGYFFHWKVIGIVLSVYSLIIMILFQFIIESHIWYMLKHRRTKATSALVRFRNNDIAQAETELNEVEQKLSQRGSDGSYFKRFADPAVWKPFLIFCVFSMIQQQAGYNIIIFYAVSFFSSLHSPVTDVKLLPVVFAIISIIGSVLLVFIVHKFNRKTFIVCSGVGMSLTMAVAAAAAEFRIIEYQWVTVVCTFVYIFCCMLGMIDIPWMMIGELFPNKMRGSMSSYVTIVLYLMTFVTVKFYSVMVTYLPTSGILCYFSVFSLLTAMFASVYFPETRGRSLIEIEEYFRK